MTVYYRYLGYPGNPYHRADPTAYAQDTLATMTRTVGLLELCHYHGSENQPPSYITSGNRAPYLGFHHLWFTVPDVRCTVHWLQEQGVEIVKKDGEILKPDILITNWEKEQKGIATADSDEAFERIVRPIAFVKDPVSDYSLYHIFSKANISFL